MIRPVENILARGINTLAHSKPIKGIADWSTKPSGVHDMFDREKTNLYGKLYPKMVLALPLWISSFYILSNLKSDKIPMERKVPLLINDAITCTFSTLASLTVAKVFDSMKEIMDKQMKAVVPGKYDKMAGGLKVMMGITAFTVVFRFLGPVIAPPLADKVNNFLIKKGWIPDPAKAKEKEKADKVSMQGSKDAAATQPEAGNINTKSDAEFSSFLSKVGFNPSKTFIA
jgi:hypothetical protein